MTQGAGRILQMIWGLICIVLLVLLITDVVHDFNSEKAKPVTASQSAQNTQQPARQSSNTSASAQSSASASSGTGSSAAKVTQPSSLTNTGPGDVIGIFAAASAIGYVYRLRRTAHLRG